MAWIESHQELAGHPKTKKLMRLLRIKLPQAIGHLHLLWWWALDYAQDGSLAQYDVEDIAEAAGWSGDPSRFVSALLDCGPGSSQGFLAKDGRRNLMIHDWMDYAGKLIAKRRSDAARKRMGRQSPKEVHEDIQRMSNGHPTDGAGTVPNPTIPNITVPIIPPTPLSPLSNNSPPSRKADNDDNGLADAIDFAGRNLSPTCFLRPVEIEKIRGWIREGLHGECVKHAVRLAIENGKANFAYIDAICRRWIDSGARTMKDVEVLEQDFKRQKQRARSPTMAEAPAPVIQVLSEEDQERRRALQREVAEKLSIERAVSTR